MAQVNLKIVLALFLLLLVAVHQIMHAVIRRQQLRQRTVVVECRNDVGNVLAHVGFDEPRRCLQFGCAVGQVRGNHAVNQTFVVALLVQLQTVGEQREGNGREDAVRAEFLQAVRNLNHGFAGGQNIVRNEHVLAVDFLAHVLVGNNGIAAVDDAGVITALVEHAHVHAEDGGVEDVAVKRTLVGGDNHQMILVQLQVLAALQQCLENLVAGHNGLESAFGNRVDDARVMRIERDDVVHAHAVEFLQHQRTVQAFAGAAAGADGRRRAAA